MKHKLQESNISLKYKLNDRYVCYTLCVLHMII